jgi:hypothetical protein
MRTVREGGGGGMRTRVVGVVALLATTASGGIEHTILHGVSVAQLRTSVSVMHRRGTSVGPDTLPGLTKERLREIAESSLKRAGIRVDAAGAAELWIGAHATVGESGACFVDLDARLLEQARLERNGFLVNAASWSRGSSVLSETLPASAGVSLDRCGDLAVKAAEDVLADFVEHYRAMNPAKASG